MSEDQETQQNPIEKQFDLGAFTRSLIQDLDLLRANKISVRDANARAQLARQVLRAIHYMVLAQKFIENQARVIGGPAEKPARGRRASDL